MRFDKGGEEWRYDDWERLEEIMRMTEEEWFEEVGEASLKRTRRVLSEGNQVTPDQLLSICIVLADW